MGKMRSSSYHIDDRGMVLVVGLLLISVLMLIGTTAVLTSTTDLKISANYRANNVAFHIAEAGTEAAREQLRQTVAAGSSLSSLLIASRGPDGNLTNSNNFNNFYGNRTFVSDDVPFAPTTNFGAGTYRVYLNNDREEGVTSTADSNSTLTLTAFGLGPLNAVAAVQVTVRRLIPPDLPGAIVLPGPNVAFAGGSSSAQVIHGMNKPAVAVNSAASLNSVVAGIPKPNAYIGNCVPPTPCVAQATFSYPWNDLAGLKTLTSSLAALADFTSTAAPGFTWGSVANPKVVFINGDLTIGPVSGAGIIICTGNLRVHGNFDYNGLILAIGKGSIERYGGGNGLIHGSVFSANIAGPDNILNTADDAWGNPNYDTSGGGTSDITYNAAALDNNTNALPFVKTSWRRFGF